MKITVRSILFNSLIVIIFAACGTNAQKKAEICPYEDSKMLVPGNKLAENMLLPKDPNLEKKSHPMIIPSCLKSEE